MQMLALIGVGLSMLCSAPATAENQPLRLPNGEPLTCIYFFTHWWEPWRSDDNALLDDFRRLREMGFNTVLLDQEWSQTIDGNWRILDRDFRLGEQAGVKIVPWLSLKTWSDIGPGRAKIAKEWFGVDMRYGVNQKGEQAAALVYDESVITAGSSYALMYLDRYASGPLLHLRWNGKDRPVICLSVESAWSGSFDEETNLMFSQWLRERYKGIDALNNVWGTAYSDFSDVDPRDTAIFDYSGHPTGKAEHAAAVEDHVEFRAGVISDSLDRMADIVRQKYPDVLFLAEIPYQYGSKHPHARGYRIGYGANPRSCDYADIVLFRNTGPLNAEEAEILNKQRAKTGQKFVLTYRTYSDWDVDPDSPSFSKSVETYAGQAASLANGFGFYSFNEMGDVHLAYSEQKGGAWTRERSEKAINLMGGMVKRYRELVGEREENSGESIKIGSEEQMFLDDYIIERTENITRRLNQAKKHGEPVVRPDHDWEENAALIFGTAMYDEEEGIFKMWYHCGGGDVACATSADGLNWDKPELDVVIRDGQKTGIVIERGGMGHFYEIFGVYKDNRDPDPSRRYKAGFVSIDKTYSGEHEDPYHRGQRRGLGTAVSPDGIHWTLENEFASHEICDISRFFWDDITERFVVYGRTKLTPENNDGRWSIWGWARAVTRIESVDFRNWSKGEMVLAADPKDPEGAEIYSMPAFSYEGVYIGMVQMFYGLPTQGNLDIQLAISRDGRLFTRVEPREPFIPEGSIGNWDRFNISLGNMPPVEVGDEMWFYYGGRTYRHGPYSGKDTGPSGIRIGLAKIKRGRFLSLDASFDGGVVLTKPLSLQGSQLTINANCAYGSIQIDLLDEQGEIIPGWQSTVSGEDAIAIPVNFEQGSLGKLAGKNIRIQFTLKNAQLFAFRVN